MTDQPGELLLTKEMEAKWLLHLHKQANILKPRRNRQAGQLNRRRGK